MYENPWKDWFIGIAFRPLKWVRGYPLGVGIGYAS
jgi:hypothetical protein